MPYFDSQVCEGQVWRIVLIRVVKMTGDVEVGAK